MAATAMKASARPPHLVIAPNPRNFAVVDEVAHSVGDVGADHDDFSTVSQELMNVFLAKFAAANYHVHAVIHIYKKPDNMQASTLPNL